MKRVKHIYIASVVLGGYSVKLCVTDFFTLRYTEKPQSYTEKIVNY